MQFLGIIIGSDVKQVFFECLVCSWCVAVVPYSFIIFSNPYSSVCGVAAPGRDAFVAGGCTECLLLAKKCCHASKTSIVCRRCSRRAGGRAAPACAHTLPLPVSFGCLGAPGNPCSGQRPSEPGHSQALFGEISRHDSY